MLINKAGIEEGNSILEPSAGEGRIIDRLYQTHSFSNLSIDCIELNREKVAVLQSKKYNAVQADFLTHPIEKEYERIIACPPFKKNIDLLHIRKMYHCLKRKGIMVSLTSPYWLTNNEAHQVEFREWLKDKEYYLQMLPDNSFMERGATVPTGVLKILKK